MALVAFESTAKEKSIEEPKAKHVEAKKTPHAREAKQDEVLLAGNGRIVTLNLIAGIAAIVILLAVLFFAATWFVKAMAMIGLACAIPITLFATMFYFTPRVAINDTELLVYVRQNIREPFRVPLDAVEVFFIGQGAVQGEEPGHPRDYEGAVAANVIVRLAEAATDWHERDVHLLLGIWKEGYITVRGLFCANIDQQVLKEMNGSLMTRKRRRRALSAKVDARD